jgi:hypothetical protein
MVMVFMVQGYPRVKIVPPAKWLSTYHTRSQEILIVISDQLIGFSDAVKTNLAH